MKNIKIHIISILAVIIISFFSGVMYYKRNHIIVPSVDTVMMYDTVIHYIPNDIHHYHYTVDTQYVDVPADVDTLAILKDYFAVYTYDQSWEDSTLNINVENSITQNKIIYSKLNYKLLKPTQTIINKTEVINYNSYITMSLSSDIDFKYPELNINYINKKYNLGVGYMPLQKAFTINAGVTLIKF